MDSATTQSSENDTKDRELIENLLEFSERQRAEEELVDQFVITSDWCEVACGWKNTAPKVQYISSGDRKKKPKEKPPRVSPDSESHYARVKRLAGIMITSSNSLTSTSEVNNFKASAPWPGNKSPKSSMGSFQNADVLSYDTPCWRFIVDPRTFKYVERTPLPLLRNISSSHKYPIQTIVLENGSLLTFQEASNGGIAINDPALSFDRRLLENYDLREEQRLRADKVNATKFIFNFDTAPVITQYRTEDNKIKVIHAVPTPNQNSGVQECQLCRLGGKEVIRSDCRLQMCTNSCTALKPLQKITPTQRKTADDSIFASKTWVSPAKYLKELKSENSCRRLRENKAVNQKKKTGPGGEGKLDWLPITRNTIGYPYPSNNLHPTSQGGMAERYSVGCLKALSLPRHNKKGKKLTLSEAANLVPARGGFNDDTLQKLTQELDKKVEKGVNVSEPLLPSVSGTKLEIPPLANLCNN